MNVLRNKVQLIGRLGKDPDSIVFEDGKMKVKFPIATNESFKSSDGEDRKNSVAQHCCRSLDEVVAQYLKKGSEIALEGRIIYSSYEDKEGITRYSTEIVMREMLMLERKQEPA